MFSAYIRYNSQFQDARGEGKFMDTNQRTRRYAANPFLRTVRQCYQCFLLHLMLGLGTTVLLLLCVIALGTQLPTAVQNLNTAIFPNLPRPRTERNIKAVLSQTVFEQMTYSLPEAADAYFTVPQTANKPINTTPSRSIGNHLQNKDDTTPLGHPVLNGNSAATDKTSADGETALPAGHTAIRSVDLSQSTLFNRENHSILFSNQTSYTVKAQTYLSASYPIAPPAVPVMSDTDSTDNSASPLVLILHTHGTEAYAPDGALTVPADYPYRSDDITENVVSVGAVLAHALTDAGIPVLHCQTMFDASSYTDSYDLAAAYIRETVAAYPTIRYVFDVHRDALQASDGSMLRPVTKIGEEVCAQVMSVVGTDAAGAYYPDWQDRLTVAVHLQRQLNEHCQTFARPINLRSATFNAQYAPGSLLLEIGAAGNSVEEARSAAYHLGCVLAELILQN